ncbi:MAG: hypothetical protein IJ464_05585 [Alistipes sp.]|nr:hypothetical protein [Alistipes sp.]
MNMVVKILRVVYGVVATFVLLLVLLFLFTSISPIYDFAEPQPFRGPDIYNPYAMLRDDVPWRRVNLHTHTRVDGIFNECRYSPEEVMRRYDAFGYDYVGISNHNEITPHPKGQGTTIYEHGYNLRNFHKLVIGSDHVNHFDALMPFMTSQLQWQLDMLSEEGVLLQLNHPIRTPMLNRARLEYLGGYDIMELTGALAHLENEYWDWALSAGHYSYGMLGDDLHDPDKPIKIASRCCYMSMATTSDEDVRRTLRSGCFYSMRIPNYGSGDWAVKYERNRRLPAISDIGLRDSTIYMTLTAVADSIVVYGRGHATLARAMDVDSLAYNIGSEDSYARFVAYLPDRVVIMSNPFARYDASVATLPGEHRSWNINIILTLLYNLAIAGIVVVVVWLYLKIVRIWRR